jgi:flavodoxin
MKAIVVYESHWGNTAAVANAIAEGIGSGTRVMSTSQADATALQSADLLVVGAPVIGFRLSTPEALEGMRTKGGKKNPPDISHPPVRTWLESLPPADAAGTAGPAAAAFDTRVRGPFGSAAPAILEGLEKAGYRPITKAAGFLVRGSQGPMRDGELERAREWGAELARETAQGLPANAA